MHDISVEGDKNFFSGQQSLYFMYNSSKLNLLENDFEWISVSQIIATGQESATILLSHGLMIIAQTAMEIYSVCTLLGVISAFTVQPT